MCIRDRPVCAPTLSRDSPAVAQEHCPRKPLRSHAGAGSGSHAHADHPAARARSSVHVLARAAASDRVSLVASGSPCARCSAGPRGCQGPLISSGLAERDGAKRAERQLKRHVCHEGQACDAKGTASERA
eukprot:15357885-Alexandrium_andersonii.AAC.1